ncbi:MAG: pyridoxamine 5'-phosphate oxidase family protein [Hydrogenophaga sp.]|uniref:HugZ family pyridoxamine 5'-phosphate oxidase n=1 Tax=Hydrogenophaga sp. TaxID=1904254 RepID=UPI0027308EE6|nr:pyridoxamine 5'-phosphate oxidase family protein [Hydrogenophaga sp.]MDP1687188.1 pyridoxamine 5'-phosphate oxidase family protein [Hydrogenophaga sp.]MDP3205961.1 pyridoxamine 5'-phosphate oxidase family protein [Hydrogenophaga sp.]
MDATESAALMSLLRTQPVASLATLHKGAPAVSMVPFALLPDGSGFVIHVSQLATHTQDMLHNPAVALLVTAPLAVGDSPLALPRASVQGQARQCLPVARGYEQARQAYLAKLPDAVPLFSFGDFSLFVIEPEAIRWVAGFGRAMSLVGERMRAALNPPA